MFLEEVLEKRLSSKAVVNFRPGSLVKTRFVIEVSLSFLILFRRNFWISSLLKVYGC